MLIAVQVVCRTSYGAITIDTTIGQLGIGGWLKELL